MSEKVYFTGRYDPVHNYRNNMDGLVVSEHGNSGVAFTTTVGAEERVTAVVYVNDHTVKAAQSDARALLEGHAPSIELRVLIRGAMLEGLGSIGEFGGISPRMTPEDQEAALRLIRAANPRVANLIEKHQARVSVWAGREVHQMDGITLPLDQIPSAVADLAAANNSKGNQHAGALRVAETLELAARVLEKEGRVPEGTMPKEVLAVNRWRTKAAPGAEDHRPKEADDFPPYERLF